MKSVRAPNPAFTVPARTIVLGAIVAGAIVLLDRVRISAALASAFAPMSFAGQIAAILVAFTALALILSSIDLGLHGLARREGRVAPPVAIGTAGGLYIALTVETVLRNAYGLEVLGTTGAARVLWAVGLAAAMASGCVLAGRIRDRYLSPPPRIVLVALAIIWCVAVAIYAALALTSGPGPRFAAGRETFNVLVVAFDGVSADRTTVYGSARDTTPNLAALATEGLIGENVLPNACSTYGSVSALLTGRSPLLIHMAYYPDRLLGADAFLHLPGVLAQNGYRTAVIGAEDYVDLASMGARGGLTVINRLGSPIELPGLSTDSRPLTTALRLWAQDLALRVELPLLHAAGRVNVASFTQTFMRQQDADSDDWRVRRVEDHVIASGGRPWFAYVHMMGTHGPRFHPRRRRFSSPGVARPWDPNEADDALGDADARLGEIVSFLRERGQLDRTVVAVLSDHAERTTCGRVPLVIRLPDRRVRRRITEPVNLTDLAPTVLGALGLPKPWFMDGVDLDRTVPDVGRVTIHPWEVVDDHATLPGRNLVSVALRRCDTAWIVAMRGGSARPHSITGFRGAQCGSLPPIEAATAQQEVLTTLAATGWPAPGPSY